jgi:hypothetical protein
MCRDGEWGCLREKDVVCRDWKRFSFGRASEKLLCYFVSHFCVNEVAFELSEVLVEWSLRALALASVDVLL